MTREQQAIALLQQKDVGDDTRKSSIAALYGRGTSDRIYTFADTLWHTEMLAAKLIEYARELDTLAPVPADEAVPAASTERPGPPTPEDRYLRATEEINAIKWREEP